ncbi:hypothetical protein [Mycolicibacter kumamotonensis]|uniref:DUF7257 domain-containing protein n=1 Tax=Mycolicibacter kumamotonensis TaxID=354243 RepID=UPI0009FC8846|nr:hypothetical protein [Mycolicibacter kumamotonensis]
MNHVESHRDIGDAVTALQTYASKKTHDHDGGDGGVKLSQANTHEDADTDSSLTAIHHTLGTGEFQAAAGNHTHNYNNLPGIPYGICTSTSRPGMPTTGMMIYETDTQCFRQWALYDNNVAVSGVDSIVDFNTADNDSIGGSGWATTVYDSGDTSHGVMATPAGTLTWVDGGGANSNAAVAWRTDADDKETDSDDQIITWETGSLVIERTPPLYTTAFNDFYFRVSSDRQSYVKLSVGDGIINAWYTTSGRGGETLLGSLSNVNTALANTQWRASLIERTLSIYQTGLLVGSIVDNRLVSMKGANYRGWGVGMTAPINLLGQTTPADINYVRIADEQYYTSVNRWTLLPIGKVPEVQLSQTVKQKLTSTGTYLNFNKEIVDNFGFFNAASSNSGVVFKEPGRFYIDAAMQWNPQVTPDIANVALVVNGTASMYQNATFMRGNSYAPGFSQTLAVSGPMRFAINDILQVRVSYTAPADLGSQIFSWFDGDSNTTSRLSITYLGP